MKTIDLLERPDLIILLDLEEKTGIGRKGSATDGDRFEREELPFHRRVRQGYLKMANADPERWLVDTYQRCSCLFPINCGALHHQSVRDDGHLASREHHGARPMVSASLVAARGPCR